MNETHYGPNVTHVYPAVIDPDCAVCQQHEGTVYYSGTTSTEEVRIVWTPRGYWQRIWSWNGTRRLWRFSRCV